MQRMQKPAAIAAMASFAFLTGCSAIESKKYDVEEETVQYGMTYFLPKAMLQIDALILKVTDDEITLAANAEKVAKDALDKAEKAKTDAAAALTLAQATLNTAKADGADDKVLKEAEAGLAKARKDDFEKRAAFLAAAYTWRQTKDAHNAMQAGKGQCVTLTEIKQLPLEPDVNHHYTAKNIHLLTRDDEYTVRTDERGLLQSVTLKSDDKLDEIIVKIAELVIQAQGIASPATGDTGFRMQGTDPTPTCKSETRSLIFDPSDQNISTTVNNGVLNGTDLSVEIVPAVKHSVAALKSKQDKKPAEKVSAENSGPNANQQKKDEKMAGWLATPAGTVDGLLYRRPIPYQINVKQGESVIRSTRLSLPNAGPIAVAPMYVGSFVETNRSAIFQDGMLISASAKRPSEIEGLLSIPAGIIKAIIGGGDEPQQ